MDDNTSSEQDQCEYLQEIALLLSGLSYGEGIASLHGSAEVHAWQNSEL